MQRVIKTGNSLAVTIPSKFAKDLAIKRGDEVRVDRRPDKAMLTFYFHGVQQLAISNVFQKFSHLDNPSSNGGSHRRRSAGKRSTTKI